MSRANVPPFGGSINFNAQHAPAGAFMSFTCGHFGTGGGIGLEIGRPAAQSIYVGVKRGGRRSTHPIRCLPFIRSSQTASGSPNYDVEHATAVPAAPATRSVETYAANELRRHYGWATDTWVSPDLSFTIHTPFGAIPEPGHDPERLRSSLLPAVIATLTIDNRHGSETKTGVFALDFVEPGTRLVSPAGDVKSSGRVGFAWRREMGVLGMLESDDAGSAGELCAFQRWSVAEGVADINPVHELGTCGGLAFEVPAGAARTLVLAIGAYLDGIVTTGLEGKYYYTRLYSSLDEVLAAALDRADELRARAGRLDAKLLASGLSPDQQFLVAHGTRGYYGSTQLLDVGGEPFWVVNEGEYCMMNTLDLSIDQVFWELRHHPWVVRNVLTNFVRHYSYRDQVKPRTPAGAATAHLMPGGISFCHDMGANNNFSRPGNSSYELPHLTGCFSYMTQEQLCNWVLTAACYVAGTGDTAWLVEHAHVLAACAESMRARANPRTGVMAFDSSRCGAGGQEITTYDSLDESLGQARANTYLAVKCWATWLGLDMLARLYSAASVDAVIDMGDVLADTVAEYLLTRAHPDGTLPAVLEKENPGYRSRILPVIESLIYPAFWLKCLADRGGHDAIQAMLRGALAGPFVDLLRRHTQRLLADPERRNFFADGGIKLSSTASNSWMSKIAMFQFVAREILHLHADDARVVELFRAADAAHVRWQTANGSAYWACSDQFVNGVAKGSRYYPRIVTAALWLDETRGARRPQPREDLPAPSSSMEAPASS
jgi:hypothetical protein